MTSSWLGPVSTTASRQQICASMINVSVISLQWRHNERHRISNHRRQDCLLNRLFRCRSKKTSKLRVTGLCEGNSPVTDDLPTQRPCYTSRHSCRWWIVVFFAAWTFPEPTFVGLDNVYAAKTKTGNPSLTVFRYIWNLHLNQAILNDSRLFIYAKLLISLFLT